MGWMWPGRTSSSGRRPERRSRPRSRVRPGPTNCSLASSPPRVRKGRGRRAPTDVMDHRLRRRTSWRRRRRSSPVLSTLPICAVEWVRRRSRGTRRWTRPPSRSGAPRSPLDFPPTTGRNNGCSLRRWTPTRESRSFSIATVASNWWTRWPPAAPMASASRPTASVTADTSTGAIGEMRTLIWRQAMSEYWCSPRSVVGHDTPWPGECNSRRRSKSCARVAARPRLFSPTPARSMHLGRT